VILYSINDPESRRIANLAKKLGLETFAYSTGYVPEKRIAGVFGDISWTRGVFEMLGINQPSLYTASNAPEAYRPLYGRQIWVAERGDIDNGVFVKPVNEYKSFRAHILGEDYLELDSNVVCEAQQAVEFEVEFRMFVHAKAPLEGWTYPVLTCPMLVRACDVFPELAEASLFAYEEIGPHVVDFGLCSDGVWRIVEYGDPWAHGSYGAEMDYLLANMERISRLTT
jgi:ATP-grasp domain, R2K clade family 2